MQRPEQELLHILESANPIHVLEMGMGTLNNFDGYDRSPVSKIMTLATLYHVMCRIKGIAPDELYHLVGNYIDRFWEDEEGQLPILQALKAYMEHEWIPTNPRTKLRLP